MNTNPVADQVRQVTSSLFKSGQTKWKRKTTIWSKWSNLEHFLFLKYQTSWQSWGKEKKVLWLFDPTCIISIIIIVRDLLSNCGVIWQQVQIQFNRGHCVCLQTDPLAKSQYKEDIQTKICAYFEKSLRVKAESNSLMEYLNVSLTSLRGRHHPAMSYIITTH